jgi:hypothetical protein
MESSRFPYFVMLKKTNGSKVAMGFFFFVEVAVFKGLSSSSLAK